MMGMLFTHGEVELEVPSSMYGGTKVTPSRAQNLLTAEDGTGYVYDHETTERFIELTLRCTYVEMAAIMDFFEEETLFSKDTFWISPDGDLDFGDGVLTPAEVRLWQSDFPAIYDKPGRFPVKLILRVEP